MHAVLSQVNCLQDKLCLSPGPERTTKVLSSLLGSGLAEFFGEGFAVLEGDGVEAIEDVEVEEEGCEG